MFDRTGEPKNGYGKQCEGDNGCVRWMNAAGTYEEKLLACAGCEKECTPPPKADPDQTIDETPDEIEDLVDLIESIVLWENAGFATEWDHYGFAEMMLYREWREAESFVERQRAARFQAFITGFSQAGKPTDETT